MNKSLYLNSLLLKNFATFEDQEIHFEQGFNTIIGETGSGKSLILEALELIFGARSDKKLIRKGCDFTTIEATFHCDDEEIRNFFNSIGYPFDSNEIIIKRIIDKNGKSKSFINFSACSLSTLNNFSKRFVDLVGQFENQKLLNDNYQLILLDNYSALRELKQSYQIKFEKLKVLENEKNSLIEESKTVEQRLDYINFQINELETLNPSVEDEANLLLAREDLNSLEKRQNLIQQFEFIFSGNDEAEGLEQMLKKVEKLLLNNNIIKGLDLGPLYNFQEFLNNVEGTLQSSTKVLSDEEISNIIDRLDFYQKIKRKFNATTEEVTNIYKDLLKERDKLENFNLNLDTLNQEINSLQEILYQEAESLHNIRAKKAKKLETELTNSIQQLRMNGAIIKINLLRNEHLDKNGFTRIEFKAETNPGEGFYKIGEIASGGELSRILLAFRQILSSKDSISIFLFDEIDTGIGGETALVIGQKLKQVSFESQVISITHLPQIAFHADLLIKVNKEIIESNDNLRTVSTIETFEANFAKEEIEKMTPLS